MPHMQCHHLGILITPQECTMIFLWDVSETRYATAAPVQLGLLQYEMAGKGKAWRMTLEFNTRQTR